MSKEEFLNTLGRRLAQTLSQDQVAEHIRYYDRYIEEQKASGKTERQVLEELGDPLLIARTIMDTSPEGDGGQIYQNPESFQESRREEEENRETARRMHTFSVDGRVGCLIAAIVFLLIAAFILWLVGSVLSLILPVLIPVLLVGYLLSLFYNRRR
ncbi:MAG TPA: DUF1700 domain-containing protein [Candidatus Pullilachnospira intestinigallinarum]|nr:DUF1700 domain-containing protein [Candidatus Pullilachnospira intestinigallinarum]